jgi:hypothetical protein
MLTRLTLCAVLLLGAGPAARADDAAPSMSAYRAVLDAQYAARAEPMPARPEEAQRIYETYLQSIGKPARKPSIESDANTSNPSR